MQPSPIAKAFNPYTKPQARHPGSLLKGYANGGAIEGPGTATSDSIPAKVKQTGEPIQVANGERIVSADQDALLLRIAKAMGHKSVDEMFKAGTGKPVGPTMKYSKSGKAIKGAAGGSSSEDLERQALVNQSPTGGTGTGPTPQLDPSQSASSTELGSNFGNAFSAPDPNKAPPVEPVTTYQAPVVSGDSTPSASPLVTPAAIPMDNPGASLSPGEMIKRQTQLPAEAVAVAAMPPTSPILGNTEGVSAGSGITRFDTPGKSPLFTNMTDAAGLADNAKLMARGPFTAQNQGAMDGIQARQDARDQGMRNKIQYDKEVAGAQVMNDAGRRLNLEYDLRNGNPQAMAVAKSLLHSDDATAKDLRGNAVVTRGQDFNLEGHKLAAESAKYSADAHAGVQRASNKNAQEKLALEERKVNADLQQKARVDQLDNLIMNGNPLQQKMAAAQKAMIMGKGAEDNKALNDTQSKALLFGSRMQAANEIIDTLAKGGKYFSTPGANGMLGGVVNMVNSKEGQQLDQAKRDFINATLRRESGAVISDPEFDNGKKQYFPQVGDAPEVIEQKRQNRLLAQRGILAEVPNSDSRVAQVRGTPEQRPPASPVDAAAYAALPSGATYTTPSGEVRRKK